MRSSLAVLERLGAACTVSCIAAGCLGPECLMHDLLWRVRHLPTYMTAISTIAIGAALLAHGAAVTARWSDTMQRASGDRSERLELAGGVGSELLAGACGILALIHIGPAFTLAIRPAVATRAPSQSGEGRLRNLIQAFRRPGGAIATVVLDNLREGALEPDVGRALGPDVNVQLVVCLDRAVPNTMLPASIDVPSLSTRASVGDVDRHRESRAPQKGSRGIPVECSGPMLP